MPTQLRRLLDAGADLSSYDAVLVGGAALSPTLHAAAVAAGVPVVTTYGMSETCGGCVYDGEPLDGVTCAAAATTAGSSSAARWCSPATGCGRTSRPRRWSTAGT